MARKLTYSELQWNIGVFMVSFKGWGINGFYISVCHFLFTVFNWFSLQSETDQIGDRWTFLGNNNSLLGPLDLEYLYQLILPLCIWKSLLKKTTASNKRPKKTVV